METYVGVIILSTKPWGSVDVAVEFRSGYIVIRETRGRWLGSWPAIKVTAEQRGTSRLLVTLDDRQHHFESEDPVKFVQALEAETQHFLEMTPWGKLMQAIRLYGLRFLRFPKITNPPDYQTADSPPSVPDLLGRNTQSTKEFYKDPAPEVESAKNETLHPRLAGAQRDTVDAIRVGMRWWFGFYFLIDEGADQERLHRAARGLQRASAQLRSISEDFDNISGSDSSTDELLGTYREAVDGWASALDSIARGAVLDQHLIAEDGFAQMANASAAAERVVDHRAKANRQPMLIEPLASLAELRPPTMASKRTVKQAKRPWRRAIIAAGSPFRQPK